MKNRLSWCDTSRFTVKPSEAGKNFMDDVLGTSSEKVYLHTQIRATHSGQLMTDRCYTGWGMKNGTGSWFDMASGGTAAFNKPLIINHDLHSKPLGRIVKAEYVKLKDGRDWEEDWKRPESGPGKMGSGYILTDVAVYDKETIEMIMDGRYTTVSSRQMAEEAWCSICGASVMEGCEHEPGEYYEVEGSEDEYLGYAVTGDLEFVELSLVNSPRQSNAKITSFQKMAQMMRDSKESGCILVSDHTICDSQDISTYLKSMSDSKILINLSDDKLPSTDVITGRTTIPMTKIDGAAPSVEIKPKADDKTVEAKIEKKDEVVPPIEKKDDTFDFVFANLAKAWKSDLDLTPEKFKDEKYTLTLSESGFVLELFESSNRRVYGLTLPNISTDMCDVSISYDTLISTVDQVSKAIAELESRETADTLGSEMKQKLLTTDSVVDWNEEYFNSALKLMGRLKTSKRKTVLDEIIKSGKFVSKKTEDTEMDKSTVDTLIKNFLADKEELKNKLAEAVQLADSKETERQKLLNEVTELKATILTYKAGIVVDAKAMVSGETLTDESRKAKIVEFASKDESDLDKMISDEFISKLKVPAVEPNNSTKVVEGSKDTKALADAAPIKVVEDKEPTVPSSDSKKVTGKSFAALDSHAEKLWGQRS